LVTRQLSKYATSLRTTMLCPASIASPAPPMV
jgi:hypothetical protein